MLRILIHLAHGLACSEIIVEGNDVHQIQCGLKVFRQLMSHGHGCIVIQLAHDFKLLAKVMLNLFKTRFIFVLWCAAEIVVTERLVVDIPHKQVRFGLQQLDNSGQIAALVFPLGIRQHFIVLDAVAAGQNRHHGNSMLGAQPRVLENALFGTFRIGMPLLLPDAHSDRVDIQSVGIGQFAIKLL